LKDFLDAGQTLKRRIGSGTLKKDWEGEEGYEAGSEKKTRWAHEPRVSRALARFSYFSDERTLPGAAIQPTFLPPISTIYLLSLDSSLL
jgi:hypothetical protein